MCCVGRKYFRPSLTLCAFVQFFEEVSVSESERERWRLMNWTVDERMGWGKRRTPIARWTILCWTSRTRFPNALVWVSDNSDNNSTTKLNNKRASLCNTYSGGVPLENGLWAINEVACSSLTRSLAARCISQGLYWKFWKTELDLRLGKYHKKPMRTPSKTTKLPKAWLNASEQVLIGFSFASDWLREWREFSRPITEWSKSKTKAKKEVKPAL